MKLYGVIMGYRNLFTWSKLYDWESYERSHMKLYGVMGYRSLLTWSKTTFQVLIFPTDVTVNFSVSVCNVTGNETTLLHIAFSENCCKLLC